MYRYLYRYFEHVVVSTDYMLHYIDKCYLFTKIDINIIICVSLYFFLKHIKTCYPYV